MGHEYDDCLKRGKIKPFSRGKGLAPKELETATSDLLTAQKTFQDANFKWACVQVYYAMFHTARALLYSKNLREHSHYCLIEAMRVLYVKNKKFPVTFVEAIQKAKTLREEADYYNRWSDESCRKLLETAELFLARATELIKEDIPLLKESVDDMLSQDDRDDVRKARKEFKAGKSASWKAIKRD